MRHVEKYSRTNLAFPGRLLSWLPHLQRDPCDDLGAPNLHQRGPRRRLLQHATHDGQPAEGRQRPPVDTRLVCVVSDGGWASILVHIASIIHAS